MGKISFQEAPVKMATGVVGIGEHHDNHWGRMLVLKLLQCDGARHLLIEVPPNRQACVDGIATSSGAYNEDAALELDREGWQGEGVLRLSMVVYQAQRRGIQVSCADDTCVYSASFAVGPKGMKRRNEKTVEVLRQLGNSPTGVIVLGGIDHFVGSNTSFTVGKLLASTPSINFDWVDASDKGKSGFGVRLG